MVRDDEVSADDLRVRERAVVEALRAHLWVDEFVARRPRASEASVQARFPARNRLARLRLIRAGLMEYAARQGHRPGPLRSLTLRRLLRSDNAREVNLRMLAALREWTGAGQVFLWEIVRGSGNGGLRLIGQTGAVYAMPKGGIVPGLLIGSDAIVAADGIGSEQRAIVASPKTGSLFVAGEMIALAVAHSGRRWLALLADLPHGQADHAAVEFALTLASMAATVAEVSLGPPRKRAAASVKAKDAIRKPA